MADLGANSGYADHFAVNKLPPKDLWPELKFNLGAELDYPERLNCAAELLDKAIENGWGERIVFHSKFNPVPNSASTNTQGTDWTYRELLERANQIARVLVDELGLVAGNRVLLNGANSPMLAACWFGVLKAGGICVTCMPLLRARELAYIIEKAQVSIALCQASVLEEVKQAQKQQPILSKIVTFYQPSQEKSSIQDQLVESGDSLETRMHRQPTDFVNCDTAQTDIALIAFTSGTTGNAKATLHFHRDVLAITDCFPRYVLQPKANDVFIGTPPFAFTFGLGALLLFPMRVGARVVLLEKPASEELLSSIERYKVTTLFTSPTGYRSLVELLPKYNVASLHSCVSAGENLPLPTFNLWREKTGLMIIDGIGATEMLHIFISAPPDKIRPGSTGLVVPGYEACVMDHAGNILPPNSVGLLAVRGATGCRYLDDPERQTNYVKNGWNLTGDAYLIDEDGYFWFQARADDMIISSGYNISANEVENVLLSNSVVKECAVVAKPDEQRGNIVKAFIVLKQPEISSLELVKSLQDFVKTEIAPYKYPREIEFVAALPRTETGKLQRFRLRQSHPPPPSPAKSITLRSHR